MLVKLEVQNFRSIHQRKIFHMVSRNYKRFQEHIHNVNEDLGILKTTGIYGANGSGKTNLLKALCLVKKMTEDSDYLISAQGDRLFSPFILNEESKESNTTISVDFLADDQLYNYNLVINKSQKRIVSEVLTKLDDITDLIVFSYHTSIDRSIEIDFPSFSDHIVILQTHLKRYPLTTLLSTTFANDKDLLVAQNWFINQIEFSFPEYSEYDIVYTLTLNDKYLQMANQLIRFSKLGIREIKVVEVNKEVLLNRETQDMVMNKLKRENFYAWKDSNHEFHTAVKTNDGFKLLKLITIHKNNNAEPVRMSIMQESRGTLLFIQNLLPAIILSQAEGINYFIDEINRSLHPILIREVLSQYYQNISEDSEGQIIFTTHEDFIMDEKIMRQDEIWFVEKNEDGETDIFPLSDFSNVRFDLNLKKNYLNGKFGGVPFKKEPDKLNLHAI